MSGPGSSGAIVTRDLRLGARLGMIAGSRDGASAMADAMEVLCEVFRADAVSFVSLTSSTPVTVASHGYDQAVATALTREFPSSQWMSLVRSAALPPSVSTEEPATFRDGWFYAEHLEPAGYRDGLTGPLWAAHGAGLIHLSAAHATAFDDGRREVLGALLPTLSALLELGLSRHADRSIALPRSGAAVIVSQDAASSHPWLLSRRWQAAVAELTDPEQQVGGWVPSATGWRRVSVTGGAAHVLVEVGPPSAALPHDLTARELDVLTALVCGYGDARIAAELHMSVRTVHTHMQHLRQRLQVTSRVGAVSTALREGILGLDSPCAGAAVRLLTGASPQRQRPLRNGNSSS